MSTELFNNPSEACFNNPKSWSWLYWFNA